MFKSKPSMSKPTMKSKSSGDIRSFNSRLYRSLCSRRLAARSFGPMISTICPFASSPPARPMMAAVVPEPFAISRVQEFKKAIRKPPLPSK